MDNHEWDRKNEIEKDSLGSLWGRRPRRLSGGCYIGDCANDAGIESSLQRLIFTQGSAPARSMPPLWRTFSDDFVLGAKKVGRPMELPDLGPGLLH
jgi:hypothetical protein